MARNIIDEIEKLRIDLMEQNDLNFLYLVVIMCLFMSIAFIVVAYTLLSVFALGSAGIMLVVGVYFYQVYKLKINTHYEKMRR